MIDTHAHLYDAQLLPVIEEVIGRGILCGITHILVPNVDVHSLPLAQKVINQYPSICKAMIGLHPCYVKADFRQQLEELNSFRKLQHNYIAVGEIGLDFYWDTTFVKEQMTALSIQLEWAIEMGLPVALHTRGAIGETIEVVHGMISKNLTGVFHCFSGNLQEAIKIVDMGFRLGIGGNITFKNNPLIQFLNKIPLENIVLETDSPYLAPVPFRGKTNEPSYLPMVVKKLAECYGVSEEKVTQVTTSNAKALFRNLL